MENSKKQTGEFGEPWYSTVSGSFIGCQTSEQDLGDVVGEPSVDMTESRVHWPVRRERIIACVNALAGISDPVAFRKCFDDLLGAAAELVAECELHEQKTGQLVCGLTAMNTAIKNARTFTKES